MRPIIFLLMLILSLSGFAQTSIDIENINTGRTKKIKFKRIYSVTVNDVNWTCRDFKIESGLITFRAKIKVDSIKKFYLSRTERRKSDNLSGRHVWRDTMIYDSYYVPVYKDTVIKVNAADVSQFEYAFSKNRDKAITRYQNGAMFNGMLILGLPIATAATFSFGKREDGYVLLAVTAAAGLYLYVFSHLTNSRWYDLENDYRFKE